MQNLTHKNKKYQINKQKKILGCVYDTESIINGDFETGDLTGWNLTDFENAYSTAQVSTSYIADDIDGYILYPSQGNYAFFNGFDGDGPDSLTLLQTEQVLVPNCSNNMSNYLSFDYSIIVDDSYGASFDRIFSLLILDSNMQQLADIEIETIEMNGNTGIIFIQPKSVLLELSNHVFLEPMQPIYIDFEWYIPQSFSGPGGAMLDNIKFACCETGLDNFVDTISNDSDTIDNYLCEEFIYFAGSSQFCNLNLDNLNQSCTTFDTIDAIFGLAMDNCGTFYMLAAESGGDGAGTRSLWKFEASSDLKVENLTRIATYTNQSAIMSGITFAYNDEFGTELKLFGITGNYANVNISIIYEIDINDGSLTFLTSIDNIDRYGTSIAYSSFDGYLYTITFSEFEGFEGGEDGVGTIGDVINFGFLHDIVRINPVTGDVAVVNTVEFSFSSVFITFYSLAMYSATQLAVIDVSDGLWLININDSSEINSLRKVSISSSKGLVCDNVNKYSDDVCPFEECMIVFFVFFFVCVCTIMS